MIRWYRRRRCLRRIADLEQELGLWPPWHLVLDVGYDGLEGVYTYRLPTAREMENPPRWSSP